MVKDLSVSNSVWFHFVITANNRCWNTSLRAMRSLSAGSVSNITVLVHFFLQLWEIEVCLFTAWGLYLFCLGTVAAGVWELSCRAALDWGLQGQCRTSAGLPTPFGSNHLTQDTKCIRYADGVNLQINYAVNFFLPLFLDREVKSWGTFLFCSGCCLPEVPSLSSTV